MKFVSCCTRWSKTCHRGPNGKRWGPEWNRTILQVIFVLHLPFWIILDHFGSFWIILDGKHAPGPCPSHIHFFLDMAHVGPNRTRKAPPSLCHHKGSAHNDQRAPSKHWSSPCHPDRLSDSTLKDEIETPTIKQKKTKNWGLQ